MNNRKAKQMICDIERYRRNGCVPKECIFTFKDGDFGYWAKLRTGWFFRAIYAGTISLTANQLKQRTGGL